MLRRIFQPVYRLWPTAWGSPGRWAAIARGGWPCGRCWRGIEVTVPEGIDELGSLRAVELSLAPATCPKVPAPIALARQLLDAAQVRLPQALPARAVPVATRQKLAKAIK